MFRGSFKTHDVKLVVTPGSTPAVIAGLIAGPLIWLSALQLKFAIVPFACWYQWRIILHVVSAVALLMVAAFALLSWLSWRHTGPEYPADDDSTHERNRFLAVIGLAISGFSALAIVGQEIGNWFLNPCN